MPRNRPCWRFVSDHTLLFSTLAVMLLTGLVTLWYSGRAGNKEQGAGSNNGQWAAGDGQTKPTETADHKSEISNRKSDFPLPPAPNPQSLTLAPSPA